MGVPNLWAELNDAGYDISLNLLAIQSFLKDAPHPSSSSRHPKRALVMGIDASIWFFQAAQQGKNILRYHQEANKKSESDLTLLPLKILFYRLGMLLSVPVHVLFVCDGPGRPVHKRGKNIITTGFSKLQRDFLNLVDAFGLRYRVAPGEAEAELAYLNQIGLIDVVMSDDVDTLLFGAKEVVLNWSPATAANKARRRRQRDSDSETSSQEEDLHFLGKKASIKDSNEESVPEKIKKNRKETWVTVFSAREIEEDPTIYLTKEGLILIALLSKGDYHTGIQGFGVRIAVPLAQAGFGKELIDNYKKWCPRLPPPNFVLKPSEGEGKRNVSKSARPTSSLKHLFVAFHPIKSKNPLPLEWQEFLKDWIRRVQIELKTDSKGFFAERNQTKQPKLASSPGLTQFLQSNKEIEALDSYVYPVISKDVDKELYEKANSFNGRTTIEDSGSGLGLDGEEIKWKEPDPRLIAKQAQEAFGWDRKKVLNKMRNRIWIGMVVRQLRREAMRKDRGDAPENAKLQSRSDDRNLFATPSKPRSFNDFSSPVTPGSTTSNPSILSELSPLSSVTTPSGSQHYLNDVTKPVEVPPNQKEAQKFAHDNGLAYLLACHSTRKDKEVGNVKEYRLEIDPTGLVKRANSDLVDEVENKTEEMKNLQSGDEGEDDGGSKEKARKFDPPLKPLRMWIAQDLLAFDARGRQLMKELDEKVKKKKVEKEEKEARKRLGISCRGGGKKVVKAKSKSTLQKGKGKGKSTMISDDDSDDDIFSSEEDEGDITLKAPNNGTPSSKPKSNSISKESAPTHRSHASTSGTSSSNSILNHFTKKSKSSDTIVLSDSEDEPDAIPSKKLKSKSKAGASHSTPSASNQTSSSSSSRSQQDKLILAKGVSTGDQDDENDDSLPNVMDSLKGVSSSSKVRNRSLSETSSNHSDVEKSPRKKDRPNKVDSHRSKEKRRSQNQSKSDAEIENGDDSIIMIPKNTLHSEPALTRNSKDEPIVLSD